MCGIFFYKGFREDAINTVYDGLKMLEYRGYDSFGIGSLSGDGILDLQKFTGKVSDENNFSKINFLKSNIAIGHTRWATHGKVTEINAHPHLSFGGKVLLVHNGIFENYFEEKTRLIEKGIDFKSETDSEVIANLIEEELAQEVEFFDAVQNVFAKVKGSNAIIVLEVSTGRVVAAKNGSALYIGKSKEDYFISSDTAAIIPHTNRVHIMSDGEVLEIDKISEGEFETINQENLLIGKGDFPNFTLKEIFDQKESIERAYNITETVDLNELKNSDIIATGCGTAYHAALVSVYLAAGKGVPMRSLPANEFESFENTISEKTILLAFSQSGETADTLIAAKKVKSLGGKVYSIVNNQYSSLSRLSDKVFCIASGTEVSVISTKAFTAQVSTMMRFFGYEINSEEFLNVRDFISSVELEENVKKIAKRFAEVRDMFIIGKGLCAPVALETALKIKEASYIHAEGFAAGELKHGVISLIEEGVPAVVFDLVEKFSADVRSSAQQIKSRGGVLIGIGFENKDHYDEFIKITNTGLVGVFEGIIVGQLLAYYLTLQKDLDPDKPRNLAKSVTVK